MNVTSRYSMKQAVRYIRSDYIANFGQTGGGKMLVIIVICFYFDYYRSFTYCMWLRLSGVKGIIGQIANIRRYRLSNKFGIDIGRITTIGYGLNLAHGFNIAVNNKAIIGNDCTISQCVTIGSNHGTPAVIGDNVYIGPGVCIVENVKIGNNVSIGAGAVVTKDVPDNVTVAGVPAKIIAHTKRI